MRIAQIAPLVERVPPKTYGGTERVVSALTEELVRRGHEVTLFASGDSQTGAKVAAIFPRALREAHIKDIYGTNIWTQFHIGQAYARQSEFDIIHDHNGYLSLPTANIAKTPVIMTFHGAFTLENKKIFQALTNPYIVTISKNQASTSPLKMNHIGTVYNGLMMNDYPFSTEHDNYLLYVGRISSEKGVHHAITVANRVKLPLIIAAKLDDVDRPYFRRYIEPRLKKRIRWIGEVNTEERNKLMSKARCFLHPIDWREPFGLTLIESAACGTPVIAFKKGSIPEVIEDGVTGKVVRTVKEMSDAVRNIEEIDRQACRQYVLEHFNAVKMTEQYEKLYQEVLSNKTKTNKYKHKK